ncbi:MAG TPA: YihY/virulence factor BrkB family protein [Blastocatellia bacterium]|nr:YihY/virulence factor BrkB family protein [Blastocatellia bacterium]
MEGVNKIVSDAQSSDLRVASPSPERSWRRIALEIWNKLSEDDVFGRAAQLAYYWLFSIFPLLIFLTTLLAFLPMRRNLDQWIGAVSAVLPPDAYSLLNNTFQQITREQRGGLLSFSILLMLWSSSSGMEAIITALNRAYDTAPARAWWKVRLLAIGLTLGMAVFIISALALIFFGEYIGAQMARYFGFSSAFETFWAVAQLPIIIALTLLGIELIYYFAPNIGRGRDGRRWEWFTPGAIFAVGLWLLSSFGFRYYVSRFGHFDATYGALGGVMVLMLWLYLTGLAILVGGEINSVFRLARASNPEL